MLQTTKTSLCLINTFESVQDGCGHIKNELDCPLYVLSKRLCAVPSTLIDNSVSFVHQCNPNCKFNTHVLSSSEHETVTVNRLVFNHDFSNRSFCFNLFCITD